MSYWGRDPLLTHHCSFQSNTLAAAGFLSCFYAPIFELKKQIISNLFKFDASDVKVQVACIEYYLGLFNQNEKTISCWLISAPVLSTMENKRAGLILCIFKSISSVCNIFYHALTLLFFCVKFQTSLSISIKLGK